MELETSAPDRMTRSGSPGAETRGSTERPASPHPASRMIEVATRTSWAGPGTGMDREPAFDLGVRQPKVRIILRIDTSGA